MGKELDKLFWGHVNGEGAYTSPPLVLGSL